MTIRPDPVPPYVFQEFPKWMYHPDKDPCVVTDYDAQKALGPDWYESPDEAKAALAAMRQKLEKVGAVKP